MFFKDMDEWMITSRVVLFSTGLTVSCAGSFVSLRNELGILGTLGPAVPNIDVCLESVPEMNYDPLRSKPQGEICKRGKTLFSGYYKREELTKEVLVDRWLHIEIWIFRNSFESILIAVANPNQQKLEQWALQNGLSGDFASLCSNPKVKEYIIIGEIPKIGKEKKLKGFEFVKAVHLDPEPFDMERDLLTPTFKKKRPQLLKCYQKVIDEKYEGEVRK